MNNNIANLLSSFEAAKPHLRICLANGKNISKGTVKKKVAVSGDVYMVCKVAIQEDGNMITQVVVNENLVQQLGITEEALFEAAQLACEEHRAPNMKPLRDFLGTTIETPDDTAQYLLTNKQALEGAACICYPGLLEKIRTKLNCRGFWILPSSIHEVIIVPEAWSLSSALGYRQVVTDINRTMLDEAEFLSDSPMYYDNDGLYAY